MADKQVQDEQNKPGNDEGKPPEIDPKIAELMKDPDGIAALLKLKRDANAEAKSYREKLEALDKKKQDDEKKALEDQGKFKELADKHKGDYEAAKSALAMRTINFELRLAAIQSGAIDPADALALCSREGVKLSDDGETVTGATEAIAALKKSKPHLFKAADGDDTTVPEPHTTTPALKKTLINPNMEGKSPLEKITTGLESSQKKK